MRIYFTGNFLALLTAIFVGLKLASVIDWSWWWVLSPLWLPWAVLFLAATGIVIIGAAGMVLWGVAQLFVNAVTYRERRT